MDATGEQENLDCKASNQRLYCGESQDSQEESQDEDPAETCNMLQISEDEELSTKLAITPLRRPLDRLQPKKRWLREACLEQQLAKPLNWDNKPVNVAVTTSFKNNNGSQVHWSALIDNSSNVSDTSCANACKKEIELVKSELDPAYISTHASWDVTNGNNESLKDPAKEEQKYVFEAHTAMSQTIWSSQNNTNDFSNNEAEIKTNISQSVCKLEWDNDVVKENSKSLLNQAHMKNTNLAQKEVSTQDTFMQSHISENIMRPTVLMLAGKPETTTKVVIVKQEDDHIKLPIPEDSQKWLGALALMELAKNQEETVRGLSLKQLL
ncbi:hypothetical protein WN55_05961 [Dufourea novaeangliae]|uniref:Uncharacterized protein n=1 Tax=Dufourea novaeangliae TaxID=178035 RepID=A0A154PNE5_DUFNO|nr:hypothetical protein WN55_05961 [Dufourea novaeangliae]